MRTNAEGKVVAMPLIGASTLDTNVDWRTRGHQRRRIMRMACVAWVTLLPLVVFAQEVSELPQYHGLAADNYPYLVSDAEGRFYARAIPADSRGGSGITRIYRVEEAGRDKLLV